MNPISAISIAFWTALPLLALAADPLPAIKSRFKDGMYETKTIVDMGAIAGIPGELSKQEDVQRLCMTATSFTDASGASFDTEKLAKEIKKECRFDNVRVSGDVISYRTVCKAPMAMMAETAMTFTATGYVLENKGESAGLGSFSHRTQARYVGPCPPGGPPRAAAAREPTTEEFLKGVLGKDALSPEALQVLREMEKQQK